MAFRTITFDPSQITDSDASDGIVEVGGLRIKVTAPGAWTLNFNNGRLNFSEDAAFAGSQFKIEVTSVTGGQLKYNNFTINYQSDPLVVDGWAPYLLLDNMTVSDTDLSGNYASHGSFNFNYQTGFPGMSSSVITTLVVTDNAASGSSQNPFSSFWIDDLVVDTDYAPLDLAPPVVSSIVRSGTSAPTNSTSLTYTVTFSEMVTGVSANDFAIATTGTAAGTVASVTDSGDGKTFVVVIDTVSGVGTITLNLKSSGTGIADLAGNAISGGYSNGEAFEIDQAAPTTTIVSGPAALTGSTAATFTFGSDELGITYEYSLDGATYTPASGTALFNNLSAGNHTLLVRAIDSAGNVDLTPASHTWTIDIVAPAVTAVTVPANGTYGVGQNLTFTVHVQEAVSVSTTDGAPSLALTIGGTTRYATYVSGSGSDALTFTYTVQQGDEDTDGIAIGGLQLNGSTVKDTAGNDLSLSLNAVGSTVGVLVGAPVSTTTVDGVPVETTTTTNPDGSQSQTTVVPVVTDNRQDVAGSQDVADIPLVTSGSGSPLLAVQVPTGIGLEATGSAAPSPVTASLSDLIREIQAHTAPGSADQDRLVSGGTGFALNLPASSALIVQTITPVAAPGALPGAPLVISGSADASAAFVALVIDARGLPSGSEIQLQNVDFAVVVGSATISGGSGSQILFADDNAQHIVLGADDDTLHGGGGDDYVGSQEGNDWLYGDDGNDTVVGGVGDDHLFGGTGADTLRGDSGNDVLDGGTGADTMTGGTGNDTYLFDGTDRIVETKGEGIDTVISSVHAELTHLSAHVENLTLVGPDAIYGYGNALNNTIRAGSAGGVLLGHGGNDSLYGSALRDRLHGETGNDKLYGHAGDDYLCGNQGNDTIAGGAGNDLIKGDSGNDRLSGDAGRDTIYGGAGKDVIRGGDGIDRLYGQSGADTFVFDTKLSKSNVDRIMDFNIDVDTINLAKSVFKAVAAKGELGESAFWTGTAAHDADDRIIYNADSGNLYYDGDGAGGAAQVKFATIGKHLALTSKDFFIV